MKEKMKRIIPIIFILTLVTLAVFYLIRVSSAAQNGEMRASGTVEAVEVSLAPEIGGRISSVFVKEGERVEAGQVLVQIDDTLQKAQRDRASAALALAQANLAAVQAAQVTAQAGLETTRLQYEAALAAARLQYSAERVRQWTRSLPAAIDLPIWYFDKGEEMNAAQFEVDAGYQAWEAEIENLKQLNTALSESGFLDAEARLLRAQAAFLIAKDVQDRARLQPDTTLREIAGDSFDVAQDELDAAQSEYDKLLTGDAAQQILDTRARVAVARDQYDTALFRLDSLHTDEDSLAVQVAKAVWEQAQAGVKQYDALIAQAQRGVEGAEAEIALIGVQIEKLTLHAPITGVVMTSAVQPGEVVPAGATLMLIGQLDQLTITVFVAEERYGELSLGQSASVTVDSFEGEVFEARVVEIAENAEFTPRNVQTQQGRRTTVFAVKLAVNDTSGRLKPGMPADVTFLAPQE